MVLIFSCLKKYSTLVKCTLQPDSLFSDTNVHKTLLQIDNENLHLILNITKKNHVKSKVPIKYLINLFINLSDFFKWLLCLR
jgi:hypothetical protein